MPDAEPGLFYHCRVLLAWGQRRRAGEHSGQQGGLCSMQGQRSVPVAGTCPSRAALSWRLGIMRHQPAAQQASRRAGAAGVDSWQRPASSQKASKQGSRVEKGGNYHPPASPPQGQARFARCPAPAAARARPSRQGRRPPDGGRRRSDSASWHASARGHNHREASLVEGEPANPSPLSLCVLSLPSKQK